MPVTVQHSRTATTPDNTTAEIRPSHWNEAHIASVSLAGNEVVKYIGAAGSSVSSGTVQFSNSNGVSFGMSNGTITASHNGVTSQSVQTQGVQSVIAGGNTVSGGGVVFSNANSVSFGLAGSTVTASISTAAQTNQSIGIYASSQTTGAASSTTVDARSLSVVGAGGVSVGASAGRLVISGATGGAADGINRLAAGTQTAGTNTTVNFANSNGITFGMSGSNQITASHNGLTSQSGQAISAANGSSAFQTLSFADSNGISWSVSNGSIIGSVASAGGGTITAFAASNTTGQSSSTTFAIGSVPVAGYGIASVGYSAGSLIISVPSGGGVGDGGNVLAAGTQTATSLGSVAFVNSNGITFGMSGSTQITASHNGLTTAAASNHSHGNPTLALTNLTGTTASASNGLTLSLSAAAVVTQGSLYAVSNTTQSSSGTLPLSAMSFAGAGIASVGITNGSVVISVPAGGGAGDGGNVLIAGTQTATTLGSVSFADSNGITFGMSGSTRITASHNGLTSQSNQALSAANGSFAFQTASFSNANGVSFGTSAGSAITASVAAQTAQTVGVYASSQTTGQSSSSTIDARSLSVRGAGIVSVGMSGGELIVSATAPAIGGIAISGGTQEATSGTVVFSNSNNITFGLSGSTRMTMSAGLQIFLESNTTNTSSGLRGLGQFTIAAQGNLTAGFSGGTLQLSAGAGAATVSAANGSYSIGNLSFSNVNGVSFGTSAGSAITASVAAQTAQTMGLYASSNTTGQSSSSTIDARSLSVRGVGPISVGMSGGELILSAGGLTTAALSNHSHGNPTLALTNLSGTTASASNGLTLSLSANAPGAATLTISAVGNTTVNSSGTWANAVSLRAYGVVSVGTSNGSLLISTPDAVDFTQLSVGFSTGGNTAGDTGVFTGRVVFVGSNNITLSGSSNADSATISIIGGAGGGGVAISAGTQSVSTGTMVFSNSNNLTFGMSGSSRITASGALNLYALGNTTQNSSTVLGLAAISLNGLGAMTVGYSNGSVQLSAPATSSLSATGAVSISVNGSTVSIGVPNLSIYASSNTTAQSSSSSVALGSLSIRGVGGVSVGMSAGELVISGATGGGGGGVTPVVSANNGSYSFTTLSLSNANGVSFGTSAGSAITASVAAQTNQTVGLYALGNTTQNSSTTLDARTLSFNALGAMTAGFSNGSIQLSAPATSSLSATGILSISSNGSTISIGVPGGTASFWNPYDDAQTIAVSMGNGSVYVQPAIDLRGYVSVSRFDVQVSMGIASSTNSSHAGAISMYIGMYTRNGSTLSLASSGSQSYQWTNTSSNSINSLTGIRRLSVPMNMFVSDGADVWIGFMSRTSSTNAAWATAQNVRVSIASGQLMGAIGEASNGSNQLALGYGQWTGSSSSMPASIAFTDIRGIGSGVQNNALPHFVNAANVTA